MQLSAGLKTGLELGEIARVGEVEVRPRHEDWRAELTLRHVLHSGGQIVVVAVVRRTVGRVGEVGRIQFKCVDGNSVDGVLPSPGEVERTAEVSGVDGDGLSSSRHARREEALC